MPASIISETSFSNGIKQMAAALAKDSASQEVASKIRNGELHKNDRESIQKEFQRIYLKGYEYYYGYCRDRLRDNQQPRVTYVLKDNLESKRYYTKHTSINFSKFNCFIHVHKHCITVARFKYQIDEDNFPDTKEAFLTHWPGPLDQTGEPLKRKVTDYMDTLRQHDSQRCIKYANHDEYRRTILELLIQLLYRNGTIDAAGITRVLLGPEQYEIQREEGNNQPLETLKKYLLLGKRSEAIKFAKTKKLWDHAQCLAFLDKYQPPNSVNYVSDSLRLKDDSIMQLNDEYLRSMDAGILHTVYRSLLDRILKIDPGSVNITKNPDVENDPYKFALLSANDCDMEYDQTNEIFKLIVAIKQAVFNPSLDNSHVISLGLISMEGNDTSDDLSYRSNVSFRKDDTSALRTLTISNIDMLILNEIWEYCLNLCGGTCNPSNYRYIINLVPYKLVFATKLFDFGLYYMFYKYLCSIKNALARARSQGYTGGDPFYDWETIERCVNHLDEVWSIFQMNPEALPSDQRPIPEGEPILAANPLSSQQEDLNLFYQQQAYNNHPNESIQDIPPPMSMPVVSQLPYSHPGSMAAMPDRNKRMIRGLDSNPIPEEVTDFNPELMPPQMEDKNSFDPQPSYNDYSNEPSRRTSQSMDMPVFSPPSFGAPSAPSLPDHVKKSMKSSSPTRGSLQPIPNMGESFSSPFSPLNEQDDLFGRNSDFDRRDSTVSNNPMVSDQSVPGNSISNQFGDGNTSNNGSKSQPSGDQQPGLFHQLIGSAAALLPRNNSKQMILPDDSKNSIIWDEQKSSWVDTTKPDGVDSNVVNDAPPIMDRPKVSNYSFPTKSSSMRYPKASSSRAGGSAQFN